MYSWKTFFCLFLFLLSFSLYAQDFWQEVYTGSFDPPTLKITSSGNIFTISDSFVVRSTDHGADWQNVYQFTPIGLTAFGTSPTGVIYFNNDSLRKSSDEGATWLTTTNPYLGPFLWFIEANDKGDIFTETGVLAGSYSFRSEDEGATWTQIGVSQAFLNSIAFSPQNISYAIYQGNLPPDVKELYTSTNKGDTWTEVPTAPDNIGLIYRSRNGDLFVAEWLNPVLYRSTDEGVTWTNIFNLKVNSIAENIDGDLFIAADQTGVFWSEDNGTTWTQLITGLTLPAVTKVNVDSSGYLYAVTGSENNNQTKIFRSVDPTHVVVNVDDHLTALSNFSLDQNYPNPFNPISIIQYELYESSFITMKVYDILGNEAAVLINKKQEAGKYQVSFNASELSAGVYFYQLNAGSYIQTKKMMLIK